VFSESLSVIEARVVLCLIFRGGFVVGLGNRAFYACPVFHHRSCIEGTKPLEQSRRDSKPNHQAQPTDPAHPAPSTTTLLKKIRTPSTAHPVPAASNPSLYLALFKERIGETRVNNLDEGRIPPPAQSCRPEQLLWRVPTRTVLQRKTGTSYPFPACRCARQNLKCAWHLRDEMSCAKSLD